MNNDRLLTLSVDQLAAGYRAGDFTPVDVLQAISAAATAVDAELHAVATTDAEGALAAAHQSAARWARDAPLSALDGIPVSIKDSFPMIGLKRWHGSALNDRFPPSSHDGAPVRRLREAGAVLYAKTTMPDFGLIAAGVSTQFGIIRNPWDPSRNSGGSSSGSAVLVAAGIGPLSLGTDMGGSVRVPSALCGLVGLKPTQGRIAYDPPKIVGSAGPLARSVTDAATLLGIVGQPDHSDHLSLPGIFSWDGQVPTSLAGVRIGLLLDGGGGVDVAEEVAAAVEAQARVLTALGATVERISQPLISADDWHISGKVMTVRGLPELLAIPDSEWEILPSALLESFLALKNLTAAEHVSNEKRYEATRAKASAVLNSFDYVISPVIPVVGFAAEALSPDGEFDAHLRFTIPYNMTSLPAGTVPVAMSTSGMPIGVQVGGRRFDDGGVLSIMALLEQARGFDLEYPFASTFEQVAQ